MGYAREFADARLSDMHYDQTMDDKSPLTYVARS